VIQSGASHAFRPQSRIERMAAALRGPLAHSPVRVPLKRAYEAVLDRLPGDRLVAKFPGGEAVRLAARFRHVTWNLEEYRAFKTEVRPGDIVLDVGANLGAYSLLFGQWAGGAGHVYAFEPAPEARSGLERHVRLNQLDARVTIRSEAMSAAPGVVRFRASGSIGDNRIVTDANAVADDTRVPATSIDAFCAAERIAPALIKIDVEGAELDVLQGARETIAALGSSLRLYVEMHSRVWPSFGASREAIETELLRQGLVAERLDGDPDIWGIEGVCLRLRRCGS
jgi:FkbM family methyltransferase